MMRCAALLLISMSMLALAGCSSKPDRAQDIVPDVASIVDGSLTVSKSTDAAAIKAAKTAVKDSYDRSVEIVVLDKAAAAGGAERAARKRLADKACSGKGSNFLQVVLLKSDYLDPQGNLGVALKYSKHPALVIAAGGDGTNVYEAYPDEVIKPFNLRENQTVASNLMLGCKALKDGLAGKGAPAKAAAPAGAAKGTDGAAVGVPSAG